jgi:hypothetical protein
LTLAEREDIFGFGGVLRVCRQAQVSPLLSISRDSPELLIWLVMGALIVSTGPLVLCQESSVQPSATPPVTTASSQQMPVYDMATIKPAGVNEYASPLRVYIQGAFGIPVNSIGWVVGPDWINSTKYVIRGKPDRPG